MAIIERLLRFLTRSVNPSEVDRKIIILINHALKNEVDGLSELSIIKKHPEIYQNWLKNFHTQLIDALKPYKRDHQLDRIRATITDCLEFCDDGSRIVFGKKLDSEESDIAYKYFILFQKEPVTNNPQAKAFTSWISLHLLEMVSIYFFKIDIINDLALLFLDVSDYRWTIWFKHIAKFKRDNPPTDHPEVLAEEFIVQALEKISSKLLDGYRQGRSDIHLKAGHPIELESMEWQDILAEWKSGRDLRAVIDQIALILWLNLDTYLSGNSAQWLHDMSSCILTRLLTYDICSVLMVASSEEMKFDNNYIADIKLIINRLMKIVFRAIPPSSQINIEKDILYLEMWLNDADVDLSTIFDIVIRLVGIKKLSYLTTSQQLGLFIFLKFFLILDAVPTDRNKICEGDIPVNWGEDYKKFLAREKQLMRAISTVMHGSPSD